MLKALTSAGISITLLCMLFSPVYDKGLCLEKSDIAKENQHDISINNIYLSDYNYEPQGVDYNYDILAYTSDEKITYLTFDDGPSKNTIKILDILDKYNIKATFFVVGKNIELYPEILKEIVRRGHMIGVHCYNHDYSVIYSSVEAYMEDFFKTYNLIKEVTGIETNIFRFPGGSVNSFNKKYRRDIAEEMERRGFIFYDWNSSCEDAVVGATSESCLKSLISTSTTKHNILLCHDIKNVTVLNLERYINKLQEMGYTSFETLDGVPAVKFLVN